MSHIGKSQGIWKNRGVKIKEVFDYVPSMYDIRFRSFTVRVASPGSN